jgi:hypothetical protein
MARTTVEATLNMKRRSIVRKHNTKHAKRNRIMRIQFDARTIEQIRKTAFSGPVQIPPKLLEELQRIGCAARFCLVERLGKRPFEPQWNQPEKLLGDKNPKLLAWLGDGGNYGVAAGEGLVIFDADNETGHAVQEKRLPATFTDKTPGGGYHSYYACPDLADARIRLRDRNGEHIGDIQGAGRMVVGPGSRRIEGAYTVVKDLPFARVTVEDLRKALGDLAVPEKELERTFDNARQAVDKGLFFPIIKLFKEEQLVNFKRRENELYGPHPIHGSKTGTNFWIDQEKNVWHCFRHQRGGGPLSLLAVLEGWVACEDAGKGGLRGELFKRVARRAVELGLVDATTLPKKMRLGPVQVPTPAVIMDKFIAEEVWDRKNAPRYCVYDFETGQFTYEDQIDLGEQTGDRRKIIRVPLETPALFKGQVTVPRQAAPSTLEEAYRDACDLAFQFYECEPEMMAHVKLAVAIALGSWFLDRFAGDPAIETAGLGRFAPILAIRGPSGSGKARLSNALRLISRIPYYDVSTRRIPSLFRPMDQWRGTLVIDECDFRYSDETSDLIHYLNCRCYGVPISRQNPNDPNRSESFNNFGLTIVTQRRVWADNATEDRSLPFYCEKAKKPVATTELDEWIQRALNLQDKLLYQRMTLYRKMQIDKAARVEGIKEHRLTAAILPVLALEPYAPQMIADLKKTLLDIERQRTEVKAQSTDGMIINALWDRIEDGEVGNHMGTLYIATTTQVTGLDGKSRDETIPLTTSELAEGLNLDKKNAQSLRSIITGLNLAAGKPPALLKIHGKVYRPIWFTLSHMEARLQDFVVDYPPGSLAEKIKQFGFDSKTSTLAPVTTVTR